MAKKVISKATKVVAKKSTKKVETKMTKPAKTTKVVKVTKPVKALPSSGNKDLDKMLAKLTAAKKAGEKSVVVYTTNKSSHKAKTGSGGFGASDLKPKLYDAYKHFLCKYDMTTKIVNLSEMSVDWVVNLK